MAATSKSTATTFLYPQSSSSKRPLMSDSSHFLPPPSTTYTTTATATVKRSKPPPQQQLIPAGHASLRFLCHASLVGAFIGKSGSSIKQLQLNTGSKIRVEDSLQPGSEDRVIVIVAPSVPFKKVKLLRNNNNFNNGYSNGVANFEVEVSAFQEAALRVFEKVLEVSGEGTAAQSLCRVLVEEKEAGVVIGKGGKTVQKLKRESGAKIRVLLGDLLPSGVSSPDEVVEIEGDALAVKKALLGVCGQLQEYSQAEKSSVKGSRPLENSSQPAAHYFHVDPPLHQTSMQSSVHDFHVDSPFHRMPKQPAVHNFHVDPPLYHTPLHAAVSDFHLDPPFHLTSKQPALHDFHDDPPLRGTPLSVATISSSSSMMGKPLMFEADKLLKTDSKSQQEVVFRILCLNDRVGGVIGRGGTIVKALQDESGANINVGSPVAKCDERLITISAKEVMDSSYSPAQRAVVLVFSRSVEAAAEKGLEQGLNEASSVKARLVVSSKQVGCLLGKGGVIISEMRKTTGAAIHIIKGDLVPKCAAEDDEVVEISGQFVNTQDALYKVTSKLRSNIFTSEDLTPRTGNSNYNIPDTSVHGKVGDITPSNMHQSFGTSQFFDGQATSNQGMKQLWRPATYYQLPETAGVIPRSYMTPARDFGSANGGVEPSRTHRPAIVTNTKVEILIPESAISSVYGENGNNLTRIRQISGAEVNVCDAVPGANKRTVVISGTPDETQAAQSLLHAFILTGSS